MTYSSFAIALARLLLCLTTRLTMSSSSDIAAKRRPRSLIEPEKILATAQSPSCFAGPRQRMEHPSVERNDVGSCSWLSWTGLQTLPRYPRLIDLTDLFLDEPKATLIALEGL
ncbi:hypothetical protein C8J56DRAFT_580779 [Mycena floridula]|nr:hypothetical protein C8J56DRAFT_580779 [Mycena floridula]